MHRAHNHAEPVANQHSLRFIIRPEQGAWERAVDFTHSAVSDNAAHHEERIPSAHAVEERDTTSLQSQRGLAG